MAECSSTFIATHSEKEENIKLIIGCIVKGVWEKITSGEEYKKVESMELEELEAYLADDPSFFPEGWLDKEPTCSPRWDHRRDKLRFPPAPYYRPSYTLRAACNHLPNTFRYAAVYKFEPSQEETSSFELVRWTFGCFFAVQYSISTMAILNLLPFCCSLLDINHDSQLAAFLLFNTPDQS